jgi:hypothetical protein
MLEQEETDIETLWLLSSQITSGFSTDPAFDPFFSNARPKKLRIFLGIIASDSSIAYYEVERKSLAQVGLPRPGQQ